MDNFFVELAKVVLIFSALNFFFNYIIKKFKSDLEKDENLQLVDRVKELIHIVEVETHQGVDYWYDKDSDAFLAQGTSISEAIEHAKTRYPKHVFVLLDKDENFTGIICEATDWKPEPYNGKEFTFKV